MKNFILPIILNTLFTIILPLILKLQNINKSYIASYIVIGISLYFFISCNVFASKINKSFILIPIGIIFSGASIYLNLSGEIVFEYFILYVVLIFLGVRVGNTKRKINELKNNNKSS